MGERSTLRWYGHVMRMSECDFTKRVYESIIEGREVMGRPPVKWINRVKSIGETEWVGEVWNALRESA